MIFYGTIWIVYLIVLIISSYMIYHGIKIRYAKKSANDRFLTNDRPNAFRIRCKQNAINLFLLIDKIILFIFVVSALEVGCYLGSYFLAVELPINFCSAFGFFTDTIFT